MLRYKLQFGPYVLLGLGVLLFLLGVIALAGGGVTDIRAKELGAHISNETIQADVERPDETAPQCDSYEVPAHQPRRIIMPTINEQGCIQKVGINNEGAIAVPSNIHVAGWYTGLAKPGDNGLSLIDGHLRGMQQQGIFENLYKLKGGDRFRIEFGDRSIKTFEVVSNDSYSVDKVGAKMFEHYAGIASQLNLITCYGTWQQDTNEFDERLLVVSRLVE